MEIPFNMLFLWRNVVPVLTLNVRNALAPYLWRWQHPLNQYLRDRTPTGRQSLAQEAWVLSIPRIYLYICPHTWRCRHTKISTGATLCPSPCPLCVILCSLPHLHLLFFSSLGVSAFLDPPPSEVNWLSRCFQSTTDLSKHSAYLHQSVTVICGWHFHYTGRSPTPAQGHILSGQHLVKKLMNQWKNKWTKWIKQTFQLNLWPGVLKQIT